MPQKTAIQTYDERATDVAAMLDWLGQELIANRERAEADPRNWGYAGSMGYVRERLREVLAFISPMDEDEIEEALAELHLDD